jgi:hypothetical protein
MLERQPHSVQDRMKNALIPSASTLTRGGPTSGQLLFFLSMMSRGLAAGKVWGGVPTLLCLIGQWFWRRGITHPQHQSRGAGSCMGANWPHPERPLWRAQRQQADVRSRRLRPMSQGDSGGWRRPLLAHEVLQQSSGYSYHNSTRRSGPCAVHQHRFNWQYRLWI